MFEVETTLEIRRPVREVFAFVADQTNAPTWQAGLYEVRRLTDGPIGVGTEHEFVRKFAGRELASTNRFVDYEDGRYVEFEIPEGWLTGRASYLAEASPDGTVLTSRVQLSGRGPVAVFEPVLRRLLARDSRKDEAKLKLLLEGEPSQGTA